MQIAGRLGIQVQDVNNVIIWGNHSSTQYPDVNHGTVKVSDSNLPIRQAVKDDDWLNGAFVTVCHRSVTCSIVLKEVFIVVLSGYDLSFFSFAYSGVHSGVKSNSNSLWFCTAMLHDNLMTGFLAQFSSKQFTPATYGVFLV